MVFNFFISHKPYFLFFISVLFSLTRAPLLRRIIKTMKVSNQLCSTIRKQVFLRFHHCFPLPSSTLTWQHLNFRTQPENILKSDNPLKTTRKPLPNYFVSHSTTKLLNWHTSATYRKCKLGFCSFEIYFFPNSRSRQKPSQVVWQLLAYCYLPSPSVKQASGSCASSASTSGCSSAGSPISTVLPSEDELEEFSFCEGKSIP